jgi:hypothetical protein
LTDDPYSTIYNGSRITIPVMSSVPNATALVGFNAGFGEVTGIGGLIAL